MTKTTLFALLALGVSPMLQADTPVTVNTMNPVVVGSEYTGILMANGSVRQVRKVLGMTPTTLRVMTDDGIDKISLNTLHPAALSVLNSQVESPEEIAARKEREAAAAATYRANQELKERMIAEENAQRGAAMRAEESRQEAARQAAAAAAAQQQQFLLETWKAQEQRRAADKAARLAEERRLQQYQLDAATLRALEGLSYAAQLEVLRKLGYIQPVQQVPGVPQVPQVPEVPQIPQVPQVPQVPQPILIR